ncbi:MAG: TonB family protein [Nitrospiraceae bacterium]|nr:TonB family protein [Nitrospiraceae bacterium]
MDAGRNIVLSVALHFMAIAMIVEGHIGGTSRIPPAGGISVSLESETPERPATPDRAGAPEQVATSRTPAAATQKTEAAAVRPAAGTTPPAVHPPVTAPLKTEKTANAGAAAGAAPPAGQAAGPSATSAPAPSTGISAGTSGGAGFSLLTSAKQGTGRNPEYRTRQRAGSDILSVIRAAIFKAKYYPFMAKKKEIEGTATVEFTISGKGYPENIRIVQASGSDILDDAAKETITRAAPFPLASGSIRVPIVYRLEKD